MNHRYSFIPTGVTRDVSIPSLMLERVCLASSIILSCNDKGRFSVREGVREGSLLSKHEVKKSEGNGSDEVK